MAIRDRFSFGGGRIAEQSRAIRESHPTRGVSTGASEYASPAQWYFGKTSEFDVSPLDNDYSAGDRSEMPFSTWNEEADDNIQMESTLDRTSNPPRPRTTDMGYDPESQTLRIRFREGAVYEYHDVDPEQAEAALSVFSPGKWMNRNLLNDYDRIE